MPSLDQLRLAFGAFPVPLVLALLAFLGAWLAARKSTRLYDPESRTGRLDVWALAIAYAAGHQNIAGFTGLPPTDSIDWLPIGLLSIAVVASCPLPRPALTAIVAGLSVAILGLTLNGFQSYRDSHPLSERLLIFAALALALLGGTMALCAIARRLSLADFFLLTGVAGAIGAGILFGGFNTTKLAQALGIALATGGVGFIVGLATKTRHVSPIYAAAWVLIWTTLASNAYFGNYDLPPSAPLALLLSMPLLAGAGLLHFDPDSHPWAARVATYVLAFATVLVALGLALPPAEEESQDGEEENPYAGWG